MLARGDRGFALIEALASLVIVAMISLLLIEGIGASRRVWQGLEARQSATSDVVGAQSLLRDRIRQLYPATSYDLTPAYVDFDGEPGRLAFLSAPTASMRPAPLRRYLLFLTAGGDLVLAQASDALPAGQRQVSADVLVKGVQRMDIAYYGAEASDVAAAWRADWRRESAPPQLVRIRLDFPPGDRRWWPDLIIGPLPSVASDCSFNPANPSQCVNGA